MIRPTTRCHSDGAGASVSLWAVVDALRTTGVYHGAAGSAAVRAATRAR
jgi:hypothetical protein